MRERASHAMHWRARNLAHKTGGFVRCDFLRDALVNAKTEDELLISRSQQRGATVCLQS
jgi:hypothetical protein